jgi:hypothetical protein
MQLEDLRSRTRNLLTNRNGIVDLVFVLSVKNMNNIVKDQFSSVRNAVAPDSSLWLKTQSVLYENQNGDKKL